MKRNGYGTIRCGTCGRTPKSAKLIVINSSIYCAKCLRRIRIKEKGCLGKYAGHVGDRLFVDHYDQFGHVIGEYRVNEVMIGKVRAI